MGLSRPVHLMAGYVPTSVRACTGNRIDEIMQKDVTLLKMDIDGPDLLAMRGADTLFNR